MRREVTCCRDNCGQRPAGGPPGLDQTPFRADRAAGFPASICGNFLPLVTPAAVRPTTTSKGRATCLCDHLYPDTRLFALTAIGCALLVVPEFLTAAAR